AEGPSRSLPRRGVAALGFTRLAWGPRTKGRTGPHWAERRTRRSGTDHRRLEDRTRALRRDAHHERRQRGPTARTARIVRAIFVGGAMMIEREADQSRGERESPRPLTPEVVEARILRRVAELRVLAAWTSVLARREAQRRVPRWRGPTSGR